MALPGRLVRARVIERPAPLFGALLDQQFTGHVRIEPTAALLLDAAGTGVIGLVEGIPRTAHHDGTGETGQAAVSALSDAWPARIERHACEAASVSRGEAIEATVPATILCTDEALARRTAAAAPETEAPDPSLDAVESFLEDADAIGDIQDRARAEARRQAEAWDLFPED